MKAKSVLYLFILLLPLTGYGQGRHLKGIRGIEITGGITGHRAYGMLGASQNLSAVTYGKIVVAYEPGSIDDVKYHSYMIDASINYTLIQIKDDVFLNACLGGSGVYDDLEELESTTDQSGFSAGILGGAEIEIYISNAVVFLINGTQRYYFANDFGNARWMLGAGMKFTF